MFISERSILIDADVEKVYAVAETYPKFVSFYTQREILFENKEKVIVRMSSMFYGKEFTWEGEGFKNKNTSINFVQTKGLLKGLRAVWVFDKLKDNVTRVTIKTQLSFDSFFSRLFEKILGYSLVTNTTTRILSCLKSAAENKQ